MKKTFILATMLVGVFFFLGKADAEEVYQQANDFIPLTALCLRTGNGDGPLAEITDETFCETLAQPYVNTTLFQELYIEPGRSISAISMWLDDAQSNGANIAYTFTAYLMDGQDKVATSTPISWDQNTFPEVKFNFTPYAVSTSTPIDGVAFELQRNGGNGDSPKLNVRLSPNKYPPNYVNPGFFSGGAIQSLATGSWYSSLAQLSNLRDFAITVYQSDPATALEITYPTNGSTILASSTSQFFTQGTCSEDVEISIYNGLSYASSTTQFGASLICQGDDTWSYSWNPYQGFWNIEVTSEEPTQTAFDFVRFYFLEQSQEPTIPVFSGNPFSGEQGGDLGYWSFLRDWADEAISHTRPFSYIPQIVVAGYTAISNPSPQNPIPSVSFDIPMGTGTSTFTLAQVDQTDVFNLIPEANWTTLKTTMQLVVYGLLLYYVWNRIMSFI